MGGKWGVEATISAPFNDCEDTLVRRISWSPDGQFLVATNSKDGVSLDASYGGNYAIYLEIFLQEKFIRNFLRDISERFFLPSLYFRVLRFAYCVSACPEATWSI